jgi:hypothetical protein
MNTFFDPPLIEFVKNLRAHRHEESRFVELQLEKLRDECEELDFERKAWALLKLMHLQQHLLVGELPFAAFPTVEVASRPVLWQKRIGLLAASLSFSDHTSVTLLLANQLRKDLSSGSRNEQTLALVGLAGFASRDLAEALWPGVVAMLSSSQPYLRKRAVIALHRCIRRCPETLPACWNRFVSMLEDADPSVVCAAVTVALEEVHAHPELFVNLIPLFCNLLEQGGSNWVLIKVLMVLDALCEYEPRLPKKLAPLVANMMEATRAKSLIFECSRVACRRLFDHEQVLRMSIDHLVVFIEGTDQNLRYLALKALRHVGRHCPWMLTEKQLELVEMQLRNTDIHIRVAALQTLTSTIRTISTFRTLVQRLEPFLLDCETTAPRSAELSVEYRFRSCLFAELWNCIESAFPNWPAVLTPSDAIWLLESMIEPTLTRLPLSDEVNLERYGLALWKLVRFRDETRDAALATSRRVLDSISERAKSVHKQATLRICVWILGALCDRARGTVEALRDINRLTGLLRPVYPVGCGGIAWERAVCLQTTALRALIMCIQEQPSALPQETLHQLEQVVPLGPSAAEEHARLRRLLGADEWAPKRHKSTVQNAHLLLAKARALPCLEHVELAESWLDPADCPGPQEHLQTSRNDASPLSSLLVPLPPNIPTAETERYGSRRRRVHSNSRPGLGDFSRSPLSTAAASTDPESESVLWAEYEEAQREPSVEAARPPTAAAITQSLEFERIAFNLNGTQTAGTPNRRLVPTSAYDRAAAQSSSPAWPQTQHTVMREASGSRLEGHHQQSRSATPRDEPLIYFDIPYTEIGDADTTNERRPEETQMQSTMTTSGTSSVARASATPAQSSPVQPRSSSDVRQACTDSLLLEFEEDAP